MWSWSPGISIKRMTHTNEPLFWIIRRKCEILVNMRMRLVSLLLLLLFVGTIGGIWTSNLMEISPKNAFHLRRMTLPSHPSAWDDKWSEYRTFLTSSTRSYVNVRYKNFAYVCGSGNMGDAAEAHRIQITQSINLFAKASFRRWRAYTMAIEKHDLQREMEELEGRVKSFV